jgi:hypothetical protein
MTDWNPSPGQLEALRDMTGITNPNPDDPLHAAVINALAQAGPGSSYGQRVVALRWVFGWELRDAGVKYATAKADYERLVAKKKIVWLSEPGMSVAKAGVLAEGDDDVYASKLAYLTAENRERAARKFLDTLSAALDNHRTDRADLRAADQAHAHGFDGGA